MLKSTVIRYRKAMVEGAQDLSDETAIDTPLMFERWKVGETYSIGDRRCYEEALYRCEQLHTSQSDWTPDITTDLWTKVSIDEFPEWVQPTGAQDAYRIGKKVSHNGKHWISTIDYNVYEPGVIGWDEI